MPSIGRSVGTRLLSPTSDASVGIQSTALKISSVTAPAGTLPGQRTIAGVRMPPSKPEPKWPRHGPFEPPMDAARPAGLSLFQTTIVLSAMPASSIASSTWPVRKSSSASVSEYRPPPDLPLKSGW